MSQQGHAMDAAADELDRLRTLLSSSRGEEVVRVPDVEEMLVAAYVRGAEWTRLNCGLFDGSSMEYLPKAARDYADKALSLHSPGSVPTSLAGQVPDGYVLVPKEPTDEMLVAGRAHAVPAIYLAMCAAAPQPTAGGDAPTDDVAWGIIEWMRDGECGDGGGCLSDGCRCREGCGCADKISDALSAERARVIAQIEALVKDKWQAAYDNMERAVSNEFKTAIDMRQAAIANILDDIRALGQQDTGGADGQRD